MYSRTWAAQSYYNSIIEFFFTEISRWLNVHQISNDVRQIKLEWSAVFVSRNLMWKFFSTRDWLLCAWMREKTARKTEIEPPQSFFINIYKHKHTGTTKRKKPFYLCGRNQRNNHFTNVFFSSTVCRNQTGIFYSTFFLATLSTTTLWAVYVYPYTYGWIYRECIFDTRAIYPKKIEKWAQQMSFFNGTMKTKMKS